ncbi:hypothetical protein PQ478_08900 [Alkalihalophilus pseudofirmus]|uniref:hypothetical protein n=1 Tax=Alkalihalophilus pseudofirmus TaxID=79885 RepID=UPI00259BCB6D|nr:hypothetical protein [Alkalihalophilus pseudofirmus]WEG18588.1 hypothetical protein PQ478_08900 [Alkalihalophilus pseudofirmus]
MMVKAYSGDLIQVIEPCDSYSVEDILEVDCRSSDMGACDDNTVHTTCDLVLFDNEYKIFKRSRLRVDENEPKRSREDIFQDFRELQFTVKFLASIVQNEGESCDDELLDWCSKKDEVVRKLSSLEKDVVRYFSK